MIRLLHRKHEAFTLVELLVVMSILCLLLVILLPSFGRAQKAAQRMSCMSHMSGIGSGMSGYIGDNGGIIPPLECTVVPPTDVAIAWVNGQPIYDPVGHPWRTNNPNAPKPRPDVSPSYEWTWADLIVKYFDGEARPRTTWWPANSVDVQPHSGDYYENAGQGLVMSKRMRCPSQPLVAEQWQSAGGWGCVNSNGDHIYSSHYRMAIGSGGGGGCPDIWAFPNDGKSHSTELQPSFNAMKLQDLAAERRACVTELTQQWEYDCGLILTAQVLPGSTMPSPALRYGCLAWVNYWPHDASTIQSVSTGQMGNQGTLPLPRTDNPTSNVLFFDGHVANFNYNWMWNTWEPQMEIDIAANQYVREHRLPFLGMPEVGWN
jgi:prepilin-type N-terminal cleavage/methylation domain-containing protein/prepilin-type processing-associated H-X9-DG protein